MDHLKVLVILNYRKKKKKTKINYHILGAIGAMNLFGIGTNKNINHGIECLRQASERGNTYVSFKWNKIKTFRSTSYKSIFLGYGSSRLCILYKKTIYKGNRFSKKVIRKRKKGSYLSFLFFFDDI